MKKKKKKETGGPAYPELVEIYTEGIKENQYIPGMTLRDYLAGQALTNLAGEKLTGKNSFGGTAEQCYLYADAMIKERQK